jgi:hypothetical protein
LVILQTDKSVSQDAHHMLPADPDTEATDYFFVFWNMYCPDTNTLLTGHAALPHALTIVVLRPVSGPSFILCHAPSNRA